MFTTLFGKSSGTVPLEQRSKVEERILSVPGTEFRHFPKLMGFWYLKVQVRIPGVGWGTATVRSGLFESRDTALKHAESTLIDLGALTPDPWPNLRNMGN